LENVVIIACFFYLRLIRFTRGWKGFTAQLLLAGDPPETLQLCLEPRISINMGSSAMGDAPYIEGPAEMISVSADAAFSGGRETDGEVRKSRGEDP